MVLGEKSAIKERDIESVGKTTQTQIKITRSGQECGEEFRNGISTNIHKKQVPRQLFSWIQMSESRGQKSEIGDTISFSNINVPASLPGTWLALGSR